MIYRGVEWGRFEDFVLVPCLVGCNVDGLISAAVAVPQVPGFSTARMLSHTRYG